MTTFLCTTGTSIAANAGIDLDRFKNESLEIWPELEKHVNFARKQILKEFHGIDILEKYNNTSAEIKSLVKMGVDSQDTVVLIASDTVDGLLCVEIVQKIIEDNIKCKVVIEKVGGLQANDGKVFVKEGIKKLFDVIMKYLENHYDIVLNPTGGYKSVVPYIALAGMLYNKPVKYIHGDSEDVITLSNIPVIWDEDLLFRIEDKLRKIDQEGAITKNEWLKGVDYTDKRYDSLIDEDDGFITLSAVGLFFYEKFKSDYPVDLARDDTPHEKKEIKLGNISHHGKDRLLSIAEKIIRSPFVTAVLNSCDHDPTAKEPVRALSSIQAKRHLQREDHGICIVTDLKSDKGFSFLIKTTARDDIENERIADLLRRKNFR